jgi:pro-apoptotic serine protease NMA111
VVNIDGFVIGIATAGVNNSSTAFFFPLDRVPRALQLLQSSNRITRGTLQTKWWFEPFDKCSELGLSDFLQFLGGDFQEQKLA